MKFFKIIFLIVFLTGSNAFSQKFEKNQIRVTGSASVYPIISYIYEYSDNDTKSIFTKNPIIESVGTGQGFESFCKQEFGATSQDVVNASREISEGELAKCSEKNLLPLNRITVGLDGITLAYANPNSQNSAFKNLDLTVKELHLALSKYIVKKNLNGENVVVLNENVTWKQVRESFPEVKIIFYGPVSTSGTYDFFREVIVKECAKNLKTAINDPSEIKKLCGEFRKGAYTELPDQDSTISRKIVSQNLFSIGIVRFIFFQNSSNIVAAKINGISPTESSIVNSSKSDKELKKSDLKYKLARPLFVYYSGKNIHKVQGLKEFLTQIAKFSYRDTIEMDYNIFNNSEASEIAILRAGNVKECEENKKVIQFEFNCQ